MNGIQAENEKWLRKINNVLKNKPSYLKGYVNYLNDTSVLTKYTYLNYTVNFINYINKDVKDIDFDDFINYFSYIEYKKNGEMTTPSYRIAQYSALKKFSKYLYASDKIKKDYMRDIKRPKFYDTQNTIKKREIGFLTKKEIEKYIDNIEFNYSDDRQRQVGECWNKRDQVIVKLFLYTGIRCSALVKLDINNIDFNNNELIVTDKGNKTKTFSLPDEMINELKEWIDLRNDILYKNNKIEEALFISNRCCRITQSSVSRVVNKYSDCIKGKHITPHKLRATYGTQLYNSTKDVYFVQECMGHSNPKTTELYIRGKNENTKRASDIINNIINVK